MVKQTFKYILVSVSLVLSLWAVVALRQSQFKKPDISHAAPPDFVQIDTSKIKPAETTVLSPDGSISLSMSSFRSGDVRIWSFSVNDKLVAKLEVEMSSEVSVPFNAISPDNKYFFVKVSQNGGALYYLYSGEDAGAGDQLGQEISALFYEKYPDLLISDITGWGGPNLLIINTEKADGSFGTSYWFNIYTQKFIQLSNRFN